MTNNDSLMKESLKEHLKEESQILLSAQNTQEFEKMCQSLSRIRRKLVDLDLPACFKSWHLMDREVQEEDSRFFTDLYLIKNLMDDLYRTFAMDSPITFMDHSSDFSSFFLSLGHFISFESRSEGTQDSLKYLRAAIYEFYAAINRFDDKKWSKSKDVRELSREEEC